MTDHGRAHAALSPSSASRWLSCPASVRLVEEAGRADDGGSVWAEEGTRAHTLCEVRASEAFGLSDPATLAARLTAWREAAALHGDDVDEMEECAALYVATLLDIAARRGPGTLHLEQRVDTGVPECWGTLDATWATDETLDVVDYKHGRGVTVGVSENPQLRLYGLGGLDMFTLLGDIREVTVWVVQPRNGGVSSHTMTAADIRAWRDEVAVPGALRTRDEDAPFGPSEAACRWCPVAGDCEVRARHVLAHDFVTPGLMDPTALADAVRRLDEVRDWCKAVEAEALRQAYSVGTHLPGLKVVVSGGKRSIKDQEGAVEALVAAGYERDAVSRTQAQTLGVLERVVGKARLPEVLGPLLVQGRGTESLVPDTDPRPAVTALAVAREDFRSE